jgi:hypothetical protein
MKPGDNVELFETSMATYWFDEDGILCGLSKKGERRIENYREIMELYKKLAKDGNKLCVLADSTYTMPITPEVVEYIKTESPKYLKAMAILSTSPLGSTQVNAFLKLAFSNFPVMKFSSENEARNWLKEQL